MITLEIKKNISFLLRACVLLFISGAFQVSAFSQSTLVWLSMEDATFLMKSNPRKVIVDVYTTWCQPCKKMEKETYTDPKIAEFINDNFYLVKLDAESKADISFKGKNYNFVKSGRGGYHELAAALTAGNLTFPTTVFLDEQLEIIQPIYGYKAAQEFMTIITYFGGNFHRKMPWESYQRKIEGKN